MPGADVVYAATGSTGVGFGEVSRPGSVDSAQEHIFMSVHVLTSVYDAARPRGLEAIAAPGRPGGGGGSIDAWSLAEAGALNWNLPLPGRRGRGRGVCSVRGQLNSQKLEKEQVCLYFSWHDYNFW
eukprot:378688-Rhodomonas_salina.2